ncbi:MAG: 2-isopropylmalate synthase, partial [SAR324 cluster bacterium]|nr:2-isopropylmalate synthase [SAR324 cluster bacterium]
GIGLTTSEKLDIARQLDRLGVDIIEAGFAASSPGDLEAIQAIAKEIRRPIIASLARCHPGDIDAAWEGVKGAERPRIHVFISSSDIQIMHQLRKNPEEVMDMAVASVERAKSYCEDVEFSPMDATRTDPEYLYKLVEAAIDAGATTVNIPDTVGYALPSEFAQRIQDVRDNVPNIDRAVIGGHCHNDLGNASANSVAAVQAGARQVEGCINGLGERAGNASLEEVIMTIETRKDLLGVSTNIDTTQIYRTSRMVSDITGFPVQPNKAIVGANAFAHEAGIHQDGMLKNPLTYEIMTPESVGIKASNLVLGKHSGRHALAARIRELGYEVSGSELNRVFGEFKRLADLKKTVYDEDIEALVTQSDTTGQSRYRLLSMNVVSGTNTVPTATVEMEIDGQVMREAHFGDGPVDAALNTIKRLTQSKCTLTQYKVNAITGGTDAQGEVTVSIEENGKAVTGRGTDPDIILASAKAFVVALNRMEYRKKRIEGV